MNKLKTVIMLAICTITCSVSAYAEMNPYVRVGIVAGGSALACGVVADVFSEDEHKSDNSWKAALVCGGIAAAFSANGQFAASSDLRDLGNRIAENRSEKNTPSFSLLLAKEKAGVQMNVAF